MIPTSEPSTPQVMTSDSVAEMNQLLMKCCRIATLSTSPNANRDILKTPRFPSRRYSSRMRSAKSFAISLPQRSRISDGQILRRAE